MQSLWMLVASCLFSVMAAGVKLAAPDIGTFSMIFYRGLFGLVILGGWSVYCGRSLKTPCLMSHLKRSGAGTFALALWLYSLVYLPLSTGTTLNYTSPLFMAAILSAGALIKGQSVPYKLVAACIFGFTGVVQVLQPEVRADYFWPALLGLTSGLFSAIAYIQIKELGQMHEPEWRIVFYFSLFNLVFGWLGHMLLEPADVYTARSIGLIFVVGLSATLAQVAMTKSYGSGNLLLSSILSFSGIVFACFLGVVLFDDAVRIETYVGIAIIIAAGVWASLITKKPKPRRATAP